jgi:hypothetical protein
MKNYRTTRTLADSEFVVGYPCKHEPPIDWSSWIMLALFVVFLILLYAEVI